VVLDRLRVLQMKHGLGALTHLIKKDKQNVRGERQHI
jgi:hypothetical protein